LEAGTQMVILVMPRKRTVTVYRSLTNIIVLTEHDTLDGNDVVPGWKLPVRELFCVGCGPRHYWTNCRQSQLGLSCPKGTSLPLALASRTVKGAAASLYDTLDEVSIAHTGFPLTTIDM